MTYLLDTNVLSETRKRQPAVGVAEWIAATPSDRMHISVLTLGEIERGIARSRSRGDRDQVAALERWLQDLQAGFEDRILPVSLPVATAWGRHPQKQPLPPIDALIVLTSPGPPTRIDSPRMRKGVPYPASLERSHGTHLPHRRLDGMPAAQPPREEWPAGSS